MTVHAPRRPGPAPGPHQIGCNGIFPAHDDLDAPPPPDPGPTAPDRVHAGRTARAYRAQWEHAAREIRAAVGAVGEAGIAPETAIGLFELLRVLHADPHTGLVALHGKAMSERGIAERLGIHRATVRRLGEVLEFARTPAGQPLLRRTGRQWLLNARFLERPPAGSVGASWLATHRPSFAALVAALRAHDRDAMGWHRALGTLVMLRYRATWQTGALIVPEQGGRARPMTTEDMAGLVGTWTHTMADRAALLAKCGAFEVGEGGAGPVYVGRWDALEGLEGAVPQDPAALWVWPVEKQEPVDNSRTAECDGAPKSDSGTQEEILSDFVVQQHVVHKPDHLREEESAADKSGSCTSPPHPSPTNVAAPCDEDHGAFGARWMDSTTNTNLPAGSTEPECRGHTSAAIDQEPADESAERRELILRVPEIRRIAAAIVGALCRDPHLAVHEQAVWSSKALRQVARGMAAAGYRPGEVRYYVFDDTPLPWPDAPTTGWAVGTVVWRMRKLLATRPSRAAQLAQRARVEGPQAAERQQARTTADAERLRRAAATRRFAELGEQEKDQVLAAMCRLLPPKSAPSAEKGEECDSARSYLLTRDSAARPLYLPILIQALEQLDR